MHLRGLALGLWAMVVIVAPIVGPVLGGWITDNYLLALAVLHQRARGHCRRRHQLAAAAPPRIACA